MIKGKRKILCSFVLMLWITVLLVAGHITGDQFVRVLEWLLPSFALANGAEHVAEKWRAV